MNRIMPWELNLKKIESISPALRYDNAIPFDRWQQQVREKLAQLLGMHNIQKPENGIFKIEYVKEEETYTEYRFLVESEADYFVPCVMRIPVGVQLPAPTVLCVQGHATGMHISLGKPIYDEDEETIQGGDRDFAVRAIREGCIAVAIEQRNFGECGALENGAPDCHVSSMSAILWGRTTIGERVHDVSCVIDALLANFAAVDAGKIMLLGNSGGGTTTTYAAALDQRISVAIPSCALCTYKSSIAAMRHCVCNFVPNIVNYLDMGDIGGLIAPRGLVLVHGKEDVIFPDHGVRESYELIQQLYAAADAQDRCRLVTGQGGHRFYADEAWPHIRELAQL